MQDLFICVSSCTQGVFVSPIQPHWNIEASWVTWVFCCTRITFIWLRFLAMHLLCLYWFQICIQTVAIFNQCYWLVGWCIICGVIRTHLAKAMGFSVLKYQVKVNFSLVLVGLQWDFFCTGLIRIIFEYPTFSVTSFFPSPTYLWFKPEALWWRHQAAGLNVHAPDAVMVATDSNLGTQSSSVQPFYANGGWGLRKKLGWAGSCVTV